jgi:hypothetical protein
MRRHQQPNVLASVVILGLVPLLAAAGAPGRFLDDLILKDLGSGRDFEVVRQFRYLDPQGTMWIVPKGERTDGASIPKPLWSFFGGPWDGKYRRAAVIHDYFFETKRYESAAVHRVFYEAMLTDGVDPLKAKLMYWAVLRFNDQWGPASPVPSCGDQLGPKPPTRNARCIELPPDQPIPLVRVSMPWDLDALLRAQDQINRDDPAIEELERDALAERRAATP